MKAFRVKLGFRLMALMDVLFAERFELTTFRNKRKHNQTKFDKKEIEYAYRK